MDLKLLQEQFLKAITSDNFPKEIQESMVPGGKLDKEGCLSAYRNDYVARLSQTLGDNFESLWTILGDKDFFELCASYIAKFPSELYDLGEYGNDLPEFLKNYKPEYLSELAQLEIEFRRLFNAPLAQGLGAEAFTQIEDPSQVSFEFIPNVYLSTSKYPLYRIWENRGNNSEDAFNSIDWSPESFLMYNSTGTVQVFFLTDYQTKLLIHLRSAKTLGEAIELSGDGYEDEVSGLFAALVSNSLILSLA